MNSPTSNKVVPLATLLSLSFCAYSVHARECVHGHSGVLQNPSNVAAATWVKNGLEYSDNTGVVNLIHYSVPVNADETEHSTIRIRYSRSECADIEEVQVFNGEKRVKTFERGWDYETTEGGTRYLYLDLDYPVRFWNGIGVTIDPAATWDLGCDGSKLAINSVCALEP